MLKRLCVICLLAGMQTLLVGCSPSYEDMAEARSNYAKTSPDEMFIAGLIPFGNYYNIEGIEMALNEINADPAYLQGKKLGLKKFQDKYNYTDILPTIQTIANDPSLVAVIGHPTSNDAVPAAAIYEAVQLPFISTAATSTKLSVNGRKFTFRLFPDHKVEAEQLTSFMQAMGYQHVTILSERDELNTDLALLLKKNLARADIKIDNHFSFFPGESIEPRHLKQIKQSGTDAILISTWTNSAIDIFKELDAISVNIPLILTNSVSSSNFANAVGFTDTPVVSINTYSIASPSEKNRRFISKYLEIQGTTPEQSSANAYSFVTYLGNAIHHALKKNSIISTDIIANEIQGKRLWHGFSGYQRFNSYGEMEGLDFNFSALDDGIWTPLPGIDITLREHHLSLSGIKQNSKTNTIDNFEKLLGYAKKIIAFKTIGTLKAIEESQATRRHEEAIRQASMDYDFFLKYCYINPKNIEKSNATDCITKMSGAIDAFLLPNDKSIPNELYNKILTVLDAEKIPVISVNHSPHIAEKTTLALSDNNHIPNFSTLRDIYGKITTYQRLQDFHSYLTQIPDIMINARHVETYNMTQKGLLALEAKAINEP